MQLLCHTIKYADNITSIFNKAHKKMQNNLEYLWQNRAKDLPFKSRYEAIILASLIEKETAYNKEKSKISAVFLNRIKKNMRLQSDPSVIHALGDNYNNTFKVKDGSIKISYENYEFFDEKFGHIFYANKKYRNYRLRLEYKFSGDHLKGAPGWSVKNSGIMLHCQDPETMLIDQEFPVSAEAQLLGGLGDGEQRP